MRSKRWPRTWASSFCMIIVDCLWVIGEPTIIFKEVELKETRTLMKVTPTTGSPSCS